ncbi:hypothetical protein C8F01DRAFT_612703 [Mycena amicta]|nr:hypothetical protein C8F01DRAFT_612703 [Mycena amicta]
MIETLPVELIASIVGELNLGDVIKVSQLSRQMKLVSSDTVLNVWRRPILRALRTKSHQYEPALKNLSVYMSVPRHNWIDILALASTEFILFDTTLPNLADAEWKDAFRRRFLPSWTRAKHKERSWKATFLRFFDFCLRRRRRFTLFCSTLHTIWHRSCTPCTVNEAWTKYIVLNRNGSANLLEVSSRNFNPTNILNDMRLQQNTYRLPLRARLVVQFADVRILALGSLDHPRSEWSVNANAKLLLEPPELASPRSRSYSVLRYPTPADTHINYPFCTARTADKRRVVGMEWVGGLLIVAQIIGRAATSTTLSNAQDEDLLVGPGRQQYASFSWDDLWAIAPWLEESVTRRIDGHSLGI